MKSQRLPNKKVSRLDFRYALKKSVLKADLICTGLLSILNLERRNFCFETFSLNRSENGRVEIK